MKLPSLLPLTAAILSLAACTTASPTPTPSPHEVAAAAGERMLDTQSAHFVIEISGQLVYLDSPPTVALKRAEGDLQRPDSVRAIVRIVSFGLVSELGIIGLGDEQYVTNPLNQQWEQLPPGQGWYFDPALLFDSEYGIEAVLEGTSWTFGPPEEIEGQPHYLLRGTLPGERLLYLTSGLIREGDVDVSIWVGQQDKYARRIQIMEPDSDPDDPTVWLITFSAFDEPVDIQPPPIP